MTANSARQQFASEVSQADDAIDLAKAALYMAQEEDPALDPDASVAMLDRFAEEVRPRLPAERYPLRILKCISQYLFEELEFRGNTESYYDPRNSFLHDVLARRTGIPITLSLVYLEVARRLEFPMVGIGMPGHFLIRPEFEGAAIYVDAFHKGEILFPEDCQERLQQVYQQPVAMRPEFLAPVTRQQFLTRLLTNLKFIYIRQQNWARSLAAVERLLILSPNDPSERRDRGLMCYQLGQFEVAMRDFELYLAMVPDAGDAADIRSIVVRLREAKDN